MKILFVINPVSGGVNKEPFLKKAVKMLKKYGIEHAVFRTEGKNDEKRLKALLDKEQPDKVASVGGDGTTLFTSVTLLQTGYPMGIIPYGSANGMAVELQVNPDPMEALKDLIISQVIAGIDMVLVNNKYYSIHIGDVGINAQIVEAYNKDENRGMITYAKYFLEQLNRQELFEVTVHANGAVTRDKGVMVGICNSRKYGTGVPLNVTGNPMDGKFEIVIIKEIHAGMLIKAGLSKFNERFHNSQSSKIISTDHAAIEFDRSRLLQLDGEVIGTFKHLDIKMLSGAIRFITHNDNIYLKKRKIFS